MKAALRKEGGFFCWGLCCNPRVALSLYRPVIIGSLEFEICNVTRCDMGIRRFLLSLAILAWLCSSAFSAEQGEKPLKVCLVSGSLEYKSNESLAGFQKYLEQHYNVACTRAFIEGEREDHLPGLENLDDCDVMLLFTRRLQLSGDELERIKKYCLSGKPIVGVRTASHAIQTWLELDKEVLGGNYQGHYGNDELPELEITEAGRDHATLKGVEPWKSSGSLYKNTPLAEDVTVLMTGRLPDGRTEPITWTRDYKGGRIFYTALGHTDDFAEESFRRMLASALFWVCRREPNQTASAIEQGSK